MPFYSISNKKLSVTVNSLGAELISFKSNSTELLWQADKTVWPRHAPVPQGRRVVRSASLLRPFPSSTNTKGRATCESHPDSRQRFLVGPPAHRRDSRRPQRALGVAFAPDGSTSRSSRVEVGQDRARRANRDRCSVSWSVFHRIV